MSIYRLERIADGVLVGAAALASALAYAFEDRIVRPRRRASALFGKVNPIDRCAVGLQSDRLDVVSYALEVLAVGGPPVLEAVALGPRRQLAEEAAVYTEAIVLTTLVDTMTKYFVQRPLPRVKALQSLRLAAKPGGYRSFESGHTSLAVACLTVAAMTATRRYGVRRWPWAITAAAAVVISAARIAAGRHYPTDAIVGGASGATVGLLVSWLHLRRPGHAGGAAHCQARPRGSGGSAPGKPRALSQHGGNDHG